MRSTLFAASLTGHALVPAPCGTLLRISIASTASRAVLYQIDDDASISKLRCKMFPNSGLKRTKWKLRKKTAGKRDIFSLYLKLRLLAKWSPADSAEQKKRRVLDLVWEFPRSEMNSGQRGGCLLGIGKSDGTGFLARLASSFVEIMIHRRL
jgi:hypothetical protein